MKCGNCGNDLMLGIVPSGLGRLTKLLPMTSYRCVRCGKSNWRLSDTYGAVGSRLLLTVLLLASLAGSYWLGATYGLPGEANNSVRRHVALAPATEPQPTLQIPDPDAEPVPEAPQSAEPREQARTEPKPLPPVAEAEPAPPAHEPKADPKAEPAQRPEPAPAAKPSNEAPLDEVAVAPAPKTPQGRPEVVGKNKAAKAASSKWSMRLKALDVREAGGKVQVVLRANATLEKPKAFALKAPPRYVLDVPGTWAKDSGRKVDAAKGNLKGVRVGLHGDKLRLVLDLAKLPAGPLPVTIKEDTLTITVP